MTFYCMSSEEAQLKYYGEKKTHRASEGKKVQVPYRGNVADTIDEMLGGLRSSCTYAGARTLKALPKCTTFVKVNRQLNEVFSWVKSYGIIGKTWKEIQIHYVEK